MDRAPSVVEPLTPAWDRMKTVLFRPFDIAKWFGIGFCAWLAMLGHGGGGGGGGGQYRTGNGFHRLEWERWLDSAREFLAENWYWLLPTVGAVIGLVLALWVVFTWLSSRGQFMFLHCVVENRAEVAYPWTRYARSAGSLFLFRLILGGLGLVLMAPLILGVLFLVLRVAVIEGPIGLWVAALIGVILLAMVVGILLAVVQKLTLDFVVPLMFRNGASCRDTWKVLWETMTAQPGAFIVYLLFQIVLWIAITAVVLIVVLLTCCCAGCLLAIPYLGTVLLLPVLVFKRAYSVYYLAQYGPEYDTFHPAPGGPVAGETAPVPTV